MTPTRTELEHQIAEIEARLAHETAPFVRQMFEKELADLRARLAQLPAPPNPTQGTVDIGGMAQIHGQVVGVNLGTLIYGQPPGEDERKRLVWYLERLSASLNQLPLQGLETRLDQRGEGVALSSVYVMLATDERIEVARGTTQAIHAHYTDDNDIRPKYHPEWSLPSHAVMSIHTVQSDSGEEQKVVYRALLATEAAQRHRRLVLLGDPGSGKSTFVRHLALVLARRELGHTVDATALPDGMQTRLPVILPAQRLALRLAEEGVTPTTVTAALRAEIARYDIGPVADMLNAALHRDAALLLIDGLDEVPVQAEPGQRVGRRTTVQAIRDFAKRHPNTSLLLTCRVRAFTADLRDCLGWPVETLAPFTLGQVRHFVPAWYAELVAKDQLAADRADRMQTLLIQAIVTRPSLYEMAQTPLLLTMMALVLYNQGELPRDRPQLYEAILDLLLGRWDKVREGQTLAEVIGKPDWTSKQILPLLDRLSYEAHTPGTSEDGRGRLRKGAVRDALIDFFQTAQLPDTWGAAGRCLAYIEQRSGLLTPDANDTYVFAHLTLQEHCAGRHLVLGSEDPIALAMLHRADDRWREPLFLGMGLAPPVDLNDLLEALLEREENDQPKPIDRWYRDLILAAELGSDREWDYLRTLPRIKVGRLQTALRTGLAELLNDPRQPLPVAERVRAGFLLGDLDDPRFPVTIDDWRLAIERAFAGDTGGYFCRVDPGTYIIGSGDDDPDARDNEKPQHTATFDQPFWIARYPITNAQWQAWVAAGGDQSYAANESNRNRPNQPVVGVSWEMCDRFCVWLSEQIYVELRMPTEAEWEAAARGGDARRYPWGDPWQDDRAATEEDQEPRGWRTTVPVGCYPAGAAPCGARDMAGNVWEWTTSPYTPYPDQSNTVTKDFTPFDNRVAVRRGAYNENKTNVRCGARVRNPPVNYVDLFIVQGVRVFLAPRSKQMS